MFVALLATCRPEEAAAARASCAGGSRRCRSSTTSTGERFKTRPYRSISGSPLFPSFADDRDMGACTRRSDDEIDWDNLGFGLTPTDYMYVMRSSPEDLGAFPRGELCRYGNIELSPSSGVLNYAQVCSSGPPRTLF